MSCQEPLTTVHTGSGVTRVGPGDASATDHTGLTCASVGATAATLLVHGTNVLLPATAAPPKARPVHTVAVKTWPPIPPRWPPSSRSPIPPLPTWSSRLFGRSTGPVEPRSVSLPFSAAQLDGANESASLRSAPSRTTLLP